MIAIAAALALAAAPAPAPDVVAFRFGWPEGMSASIAYERSKVRDGAAPAALSLKGRLSSTADRDVVRVRFGDWTGGAEDPLLAAAGQVTTVVSRDGAFVRVEGIEPAMQAIQAKLGAVEGPAREPLQRFQKMAPALLTKEATETWSMLGEMSTTTEVVLVTEPARLVPHRYEKTRTMTVRPSAAAPAEAKPMSGRDATVWTFGYAPAPSR